MSIQELFMQPVKPSAGSHAEHKLRHKAARNQREGFFTYDRPTFERYAVEVPRMKVEVPRIEVPRIEVPKIETPKIEVKTKIEGPKIESKVEGPTPKGEAKPTDTSRQPSKVEAESKVSDAAKAAGVVAASLISAGAYNYSKDGHKGNIKSISDKSGKIMITLGDSFKMCPQGSVTLSETVTNPPVDGDHNITTVVSDTQIVIDMDSTGIDFTNASANAGGYQYNISPSESLQCAPSTVTNGAEELLLKAANMFGIDFDKLKQYAKIAAVIIAVLIAYKIYKFVA